MYSQPVFEPGVFFHLFNHGNGNDNLFRCDDNYNYFILKYTEYIKPIVDTYAYCLLPNHFHYLIKIREEEKLTFIQEIYFEKN